MAADRHQPHIEVGPLPDQPGRYQIVCGAALSGRSPGRQDERPGDDRAEPDLPRAPPEAGRGEPAARPLDPVESANALRVTWNIEPQPTSAAPIGRRLPGARRAHPCRTILASSAAQVADLLRVRLTVWRGSGAGAAASRRKSMTHTRRADRRFRFSEGVAWRRSLLRRCLHDRSDSLTLTVEAPHCW